jgi:hypothetical protein
MDFEDKAIAVVNLLLDKSNPRHPNMNNQLEIFNWMLDGNNRIGEKVFQLAKDIAANGINPSDRIIVEKVASNNSSDYLVLEGNRRVAALKLLNNPHSAPNEKWKNKFSEITKNYTNKITTVSCVEFASREKAFHFIELKHLGEQKGKGTVPWDPEQKTRHESRVHKKGKNERALALLDYVRKSEFFSSETKKNAASGFPITTLERLLSDADFRSFLGLSINEDGEIAFSVEETEVRKPVAKVINDFRLKKEKS